jgi:SAM-dependent methyltransferase
MMLNGTCLVCGGSGLRPRFETLLECPICGFVTARLDQPLNAADLYGRDYFHGKEYLDYRAEEAFLKKNFRLRLNEVLQRRASGRLLEIGAAYGFFLDLAKEHFEVIGFEVSPVPARCGRESFGVDIRTDDFLRAGPADIGGPVDVTVMWDVIEHLERPDLVLAHVSALSRPGALLYITTGDIGSCVARARGAKWRMIHPPTHLHYFSRSTLQRLLNNCGFRVVRTRSVGVARSLRQVLYSIFVLRLRRPRAYETLAKLVPPTWGFTLNMFDIMQVVAEKSAGACT